MTVVFQSEAERQLARQLIDQARRATIDETTPKPHTVCARCSKLLTRSQFRFCSNACQNQGRPRKHGTSNSYKNGCRCDECRLAHNAYKREWHRRRVAAA